MSTRRLSLERPENRPQKVLEIDMPNGTTLKLLLRRMTIAAANDSEIRRGADLNAMKEGKISSMEYGMRFLESECTNFNRDAIADLSSDDLLAIVQAVSQLRTDGAVTEEKKTDGGTATAVSA